jgi:MYXO-CTERM domain-containing protein
MRLATVLTLGVALTGAPAAAEAFCGFYVSGADAKLYNNATMVVLMRDGTRTVLSMQNNYDGPPQDFAMVVPVPVVLQKDNVVTLPPEVFDRVDQLASPRLVEYWEQDPCNPQPEYEPVMMAGGAPTMDAEDEGGGEHGVKIEARFTVGEYEILILSAEDSTGLDTWLRQKKYRIPAGAEKLLRPYVTQGMKFFVAKVNAKKVKRANGRIMLSPLRFYYDSAQFNLPIRLGLVNSAGTQDLLVHILAPGQRYEVANYQNVTIPTNLDVSDDTRNAFGAFYAALFDATVARHEGAVVTEYSWDASSCDPCPTPPLEPTDLATLGADVVPSGNTSFTLTRLHARYGKDTVGEDLVFRAARPIVGGREIQNEGGRLERGARPEEGGINNFQARYVIRHAWTGPIACEKPQRGIWGGPPGGGEPPIRPAMQIAFAPRDQKLSTFLAQDVEEIDYKVSQADKGARFKPSGIPPKGGSCAGCAAATGGSLVGILSLLGLAAIGLGRRRRR